MTTYSDTLLFLVNGITRLSNPGDTIQLSRNLTLTSASTFTATAVKADSNKLYFLKGVSSNVTTVTANYNVLATDYLVAVGTISTAIAITLPSSPALGDTYIIKDAGGLSATHNITVNGNGNNIDGASTYNIATNYASITVVFGSTDWMVL